MSTKIYNGRLITLGLTDAYHKLIEAKAKMQAIANEQRAEYLAHRTANMIDRAAINGETAYMALSQAWQELVSDQQEIKKTGRRNPVIDFESEVYLFPVGGEVLCIHNTEQKALREWFDALPFVEDFAYWDSTDPDEAVSEQDWNTRRDMWNIALPGAGVPNDRGLTLNLVSDYFVLPIPVADVHLRLPSRENRILSATVNRYHAEIISALPEDRKTNTSYFYETYRQASEDTARRHEIAEEVIPLIRELAPADLNRPLEKGPIRPSR